MKMMETVDVDGAKNLIAKGLTPTNFSLTPEGLGVVEVIEPTGRATCRICGKKIKNGKQVRGFTAFYDEAFLAEQVSIHLDCSLEI